MRRESFADFVLDDVDRLRAVDKLDAFRFIPHEFEIPLTDLLVEFSSPAFHPVDCNSALMSPLDNLTDPGRRS